MRPSRAARSLKATLFECSHVIGAQGEPLSTLAFLREAPVPIRFDTLGIIGFDDVDRVWLLRQLNGQFSKASASRIGAPKFVVLPRAKQVHEAGNTKRTEVLIESGR